MVSRLLGKLDARRQRISGWLWAMAGAAMVAAVAVVARPIPADLMNERLSIGLSSVHLIVCAALITEGKGPASREKLETSRKDRSATDRSGAARSRSPEPSRQMPLPVGCADYNPADRSSVLIFNELPESAAKRQIKRRSWNRLHP
jgi:hypothetical protein